MKTNNVSGGIKGFSTLEKAQCSSGISQVTLTNTYLCNENPENISKNLSKDRITPDEKVIKSYQALRSLRNPFKYSNDLCHLSSGIEGPS